MLLWFSLPELLFLVYALQVDVFNAASVGVLQDNLVLSTGLIM